MPRSGSRSCRASAKRRRSRRDAGSSCPMDLRLIAASRPPRTRRRRRAARAAGLGVGRRRPRRRTRHVARGGHAARAQRHLLLPALHAVQARVGWISPGALDYVCRRLDVPPAEAYGVATLLRAVRDWSRGRRAVAARLRRHRLHVPRRGGARAPSSSAPSARPARTRRTAARSGSEPVPRPVRAGTGRARHAAPASGASDGAIGSASVRRRGRRAGRRRDARVRAVRDVRPASGEPARCCAGSATSTRRASTATAPPAATRRCAGRSSWARPA